MNPALIRKAIVSCIAATWQARGHLYCVLPEAQ
jgi:hypothetical protein